ncbi:hypothetical protein ACVDG3_08950 [Meridianimarinicoccus sp. RP-17]|nr:hypothetical protein [Phycocomes zhengii]
MPFSVYLGLIGGAIAAAALTIALAQAAGILAALAPVALVLAWLVRQGA